MNNKIFVIGLPRTATTSLCKAMVELGFATAHTAYIEKCFEQAQVIADTPIFCDYQALDQYYPNAKFINLTRELSQWVPSIKQLLQRMHVNLQREDGGFNTIIKRCYNEVFSPLTTENINNDQFLIDCYQRHQQNIQSYFLGREQDILHIDISANDSFERLLAFLAIEQTPLAGFDHVNRGGKVTAWKQVKSPLKVESTRRGRMDPLPYPLIK
ncbi:sulfotransferase [Psychrobium sp. 1_MG-2023]|uniref:sulfotransferase n=1 Tax=Psychrobium sp. 1_MG-2023 TaxID=3062624 RepID=UPI000C31C340|nr:sulfotransferase [Psychrobium sp. 1_MG-2023]MDP2561210.1 sulfotransferase [Psychrobium sp. 1_MG-2023]PKF55316.1 sulfotransferase family protein [Alteromonadales bacterium alter-6D02]